MTASKGKGVSVIGVYKNAARLTVPSAFSKFCLISTELYLAAVLGPSDYGLFSIAFAFLLVISNLAQTGFNFGIVQYLSLYIEQNDNNACSSVARVSLTFVFILSVLLAGGVFCGAERLAVGFLGKPELTSLLLITAVIIPFESLNQCLGAIFRGLRCFGYHVLVVDLMRNVALLGSIIFSFLGILDTVTVFYVVSLGTALSTLTGVMALAEKVNLLRGFERDIEIFKRIFSFSYLLFFWQVLQKSANRLVLLISGAILVASHVGVLALAMRFVNLLGFPQTVFNTVNSVEFARLHHLDNYSEINRLFQIVTLTLSIVSVMFCTPLILNANVAMALFGSEYASYGWVLSILLIAKLVDVGSGPAVQILIACRRRKIVLVLAGCDTVIQLFFVVPLIINLGLPGAVYGNAIRSIIIIALRHLFLYHLLGVYCVTRTLWLFVVCGFLAWTVGVLLMQGVTGTGSRFFSTVLVLFFMIAVIAVIIPTDSYMGGKRVVERLKRVGKDSKG